MWRASHLSGVKAQLRMKQKASHLCYFYAAFSCAVFVRLHLGTEQYSAFLIPRLHLFHQWKRISVK